ncbi:MAG: transcription elongation factor GreB [Gammaproteobacteria bacterium]|nr:transcription elongation factor GreB [Gammaproteobacteria bacterium]
MGRRRLPAAAKSPYITADGYAALQHETRCLWQKRTEVTAALAAAAAEGDRSENAEYIYRKKELAGIDRRIRYLQKRMPDLKVIRKVPDNPEQVFFGAWVELEDESGNTVTYRVVGPDELDLQNGWISIDSPLARALMKKSIDDDVRVSTPEGEREYVVVAVSYSSPCS